MASFLLTSRTRAGDIIAQQRAARPTTLQLVDAVAAAELQTLRRELPGIGLVQVIHVVDGSALSQAKAVAPYVDALLLDSGNPNLEVKELGGTGRVHNWDISRELVASVAKPVYLAGGLNPANVREAIDRVPPFGVDICSGVRRDGKLNQSLLRAFMQACGY